jgi:hypothetical protein
MMSKEFIEFEQSLIGLKTELLNELQPKNELIKGYILFSLLWLLSSSLSVFILSGYSIIPVWIFFTVTQGLSAWVTSCCLVIHLIFYQLFIRKIHVEEIQVANRYFKEIASISKELIKNKLYKN